MAEQRRSDASGTLVFVTTDGLIDQIGGPKEIAFGKRRMREAICAIASHRRRRSARPCRMRTGTGKARSADATT
jgi:hypothetical protein